MRRHPRLGLASLIAITIAGLAACEGIPTSVRALDASPDATAPDGAPFVCPFESLPFIGEGPAPLTITTLRIECTADLIAPWATATHPVPDELAAVQQAVGIFLDAECLSVPRMATNETVSGEEIAFAPLVDRRVDPELFNSICSAAEWPMSVFMGTATEFPTTLGNVMVAVGSAE